MCQAEYRFTLDSCWQMKIGKEFRFGVFSVLPWVLNSSSFLPSKRIMLEYVLNFIFPCVQLTPIY